MMIFMMDPTVYGGTENEENFVYEIDTFADIRILRYQVPGFEDLALQQKKLLYFLSQAALYGRDITFDQFGKYNLAVRKVLEHIYKNYNGDKGSDEFKAFEVYLKRVWFSNGVHHHYSGDKFVPGFSEPFFRQLLEQSGPIVLKTSEQPDVEMVEKVIQVIFDPALYAKKVSLDPDYDLVKTSSVNFYEGVTQAEVEAFYDDRKDPKDKTPISYGLNSKVTKTDGQVTEQTYSINGMYGPAIEKILYWLGKAMEVAENPEQKEGLKQLMHYYESGNLETWDVYNVLWVKDLKSHVDYVNGFIEVYDDPLGMKATWESIVNFKNTEATERALIISANAQWFEDRSPVDPRFRKEEVKGVSAKVITIVQLGGACYPTTPIGINLPNADWIRKEHGSKSVTLENITEAYYKSSLHSGFYEEFLADEEEMRLIKEYGYISDILHTDLHECLGHGSGQLLPGVSSDALKNYHSALEETRADLFALYFMMDPKLIELGLLPNKDAAKAAYIDYIQNGLMTQLKRVELGKEVEQAHMRCRQLIAKWVYEHGKDDGVIIKFVKDGKTFFKITDFGKMRDLLGQLLAEVQRIKSEGDFEAGKELVEAYAIKVDPELHKEVKERYGKLGLAPYAGFINPKLVPVIENGEIMDVKVGYVVSYSGQMLEYSTDYSTLPLIN
jgi:dipeptidyl-peptidase III